MNNFFIVLVFLTFSISISKASTTSKEETTLESSKKPINSETLYYEIDYLYILRHTCNDIYMDISKWMFVPSERNLDLESFLTVELPYLLKEFEVLKQLDNEFSNNIIKEINLMSSESLEIIREMKEFEDYEDYEKCDKYREKVKNIIQPLHAQINDSITRYIQSRQKILLEEDVIKKSDVKNKARFDSQKSLNELKYSVFSIYINTLNWIYLKQIDNWNFPILKIEQDLKVLNTPNLNYFFQLTLSTISDDIHELAEFVEEITTTLSEPSDFDNAIKKLISEDNFYSTVMPISTDIKTNIDDLIINLNEPISLEAMLIKVREQKVNFLNQWKHLFDENPEMRKSFIEMFDTNLSHIVETTYTKFNTEPH